MPSNHRLTVLVLACASTLLGTAGIGFSVQNPGGDALHVARITHGLVNHDLAWAAVFHSSMLLVGAGIALLAFSAIELDPDPKRRLRNWKMCGCLGVLLLPAPVLGMAASTAVARAQRDSLVLPNQDHPYSEPSKPLVHYPAIAVSAVGLTLGAIGAGLLTVALVRGVRLRREIAEGPLEGRGWKS